MTKQNILNLAKGLSQVGQLKGVKFAYGVARNTNILESFLKEFEKARIALLKSCSELDEKGEVKRDNKEQPIWKDKKAWDEEYKKLAEEDAKVDLFKIDLIDVPTDITASQLSGIFEIIKEKVKEEPAPK